MVGQIPVKETHQGLLNTNTSHTSGSGCPWIANANCRVSSVPALFPKTLPKYRAMWTFILIRYNFFTEYAGNFLGDTYTTTLFLHIALKILQGQCKITVTRQELFLLKQRSTITGGEKNCFCLAKILVYQNQHPPMNCTTSGELNESTIYLICFVVCVLVLKTIKERN